MITKSEVLDFVDILQKAQDVHYSEAYKTLSAPTFSAEFGKKYCRIVSDNGTQRSVFCFIEMSNGDILKSAGWAAPAKGARGHISNGVSELTPYGAQYKTHGGTFGHGLLRNPE